MIERKLPVGIPSFEEIRNGSYLYVDKTEYVWKLVQTGKLYILSRPRRFGKSLLTSTLEAYFLGEKELFKGLYIESAEKDWIAYPVLHFDFSGGDYLDEGGLAKKLGRIITEYEKQYHIQTVDDDLTGKFENLIKELKRTTGRQVVVLVDGYDKPLLNTMEINEEQEEKNRQIFKSFFGVLKGTDQYLKFVFFTGVTKFSNDLNHLNDISLNDSFSAICGITEEEMKQNFEPEIIQLAEKKKQSREECLKELARMYDGYHFSQNGTGVYNPFSLLNAFYNKNYGSYWYATGTTAYLIRKLQNTEFTPEAFANGIDAEEEDLSNTQTEKPEPIALLYQTGYLTIERYDNELEAYILSFPNEEVKYGFLKALVPTVLGEKDAENTVSARKMALDLKNGNLEAFIARLEALFAGIPYFDGQQKSYEQEWRNEVWLICALMGQIVKSEVHTSLGRADCIVETKEYVYIFEFKLDKSAEEALEQIEKNGYALPYKADKRQIIKVGINFSSDKRNVEKYLAA